MRIIAFLFACFFSHFLTATPLSKIVVFGDSLSDNGNLYQRMQIPEAPYYKGRFSNGPIWIDHLLQSYSLKDSDKYLEDYAIGGAGVSDDDEDDVLFSIQLEISDYLAAHQQIADKNALFVIWIGANNYLSDREDTETVLSEVNGGIVRSVKRLIKHGAEHFLFINLPDMGKMPFARKNNNMEALSYYTDRHNQALADSFVALQQTYPQVQWLYYDIHQSVEDLMNNPQQYDMDNITDSCKTPEDEIPEHQCKSYFFFDGTHPTTHSHQLLAEAAKEILDKEDITFESS